MLTELGLAAIRPFWRMDRADLEDLSELPLPPGREPHRPPPYPSRKGEGEFQISKVIS